jgi:hypothetical protein
MAKCQEPVNLLPECVRVIAVIDFRPGITEDFMAPHKDARPAGFRDDVLFRLGNRRGTGGKHIKDVLEN